jgi:ketosteroid isomerase-like protein
MPQDHSALIKHMYERFNARDIDGVLSVLADNVTWANGMDGGHVHGQEEVRSYWSRQGEVVSPRVEPVAIRSDADGVVVVEVIQKVFDLQGRPLSEQTHGLSDKTVLHIFTVQEGKVARFDIGDAS